jgi:DNA gyrase subunit B
LADANRDPSRGQGPCDSAAVKQGRLGWGKRVRTFVIPARASLGWDDERRTSCYHGVTQAVRTETTIRDWLEWQALTDIDAVQRRPGMYVGDTTDGSGLHHMIGELVDNAINEALAGHCNRIDVTLNVGGSVTVRDNGRGIPTDIHRGEGVSVPEVIMTRLAAVMLFDANANTSGHLQGVGVAVVIALSEMLEARIFRDGKEHFIRFRLGHPEAPLAIVGNAERLDGHPRRGTEITFLPSPRFFANTAFGFEMIAHRVRGLASLNAGATIVIADQRSAEKNEIVLRI